MLVDQRRQKIVKVAQEKGFVSLQELVDDVGASESTIRRDLEHLDGTGQIRRTRGGAAYVGDSLRAFEDRQFAGRSEKQRIGKAVAEMVEAGDTLLLDGGTTTLEVARQLGGKPLQVVTNSVPIVNALANQPNIELVFAGGYIYPKTGVALGPLTVDTLRKINTRRLVMSTSGITTRGLFNDHTLLVETERTMMEAAEQVIVVADHGKFGRTGLVHLCPLDAVDRFVVDSGITPEWRGRVEEARAELVVVD